MSIYQLEHDGDVRELRRLAVESDSPTVRARAASALGAVADGDDAATETLIRTAVDDSEASVRATAVDAIDGLGRGARRRLFARLSDVDVGAEDDLPVEVLADALESDTSELRMAAASAIGRDAVAEAVPALLERIDDPNPQVRKRVVEAAGQVGDARTVDPLSAISADASTGIRRAVATALGDVGGQEALDALGPLLDHEALPVRRDAVVALGQFERCRPIGELVERLGDDAGPIRRAAALAIVDLLSNAPPEESHALRAETVEALATSHDEVVVRSLIELFEESTEPRRRRNAAWLLGRASDQPEAAIETLVAALDDEDETVRRFAATSLIEMDMPEVEDAILDALETVYGEGRTMILFVLGKVGTERSRNRLVRLIDEVDDPDVQERTLAALSRLRGT